MQHTYNEFTTAYLRAMIWSSMDESTPSGGEPLDKNYGIEDLSEEAAQKAIAECTAFCGLAEALLTDSNLLAGRSSVMAQAGHDFWLTRCHHGAGFWDGDWEETAGTALTQIAHNFGEVWVILNDDNKIDMMQ